MVSSILVLPADQLKILDPVLMTCYVQALGQRHLQIDTYISTLGKFQRASIKLSRAHVKELQLGIQNQIRQFTDNDTKFSGRSLASYSYSSLDLQHDMYGRGQMLEHLSLSDRFSMWRLTKVHPGKARVPGMQGRYCHTARVLEVHVALYIGFAAQ